MKMQRRLDLTRITEGDTLLGLSPSEIAHIDLIEDEMDPIWVGHQGCPEMDLSNCFSS